MKRGRLDRRDKASAALVITLLCVVLLTIVVVAFMQTMSLSLTTSKSYVDIQRATFAAQAGLDTAIAQISLATGTNLAFVTGQTNFPSIDTSVTVIGAGNLTNLDQIMPLVSGPITYLTNFGNTNSGPAEFTNNFYNYTSPLLTSAAGYATNTVDVNTPYQFIDGSAGDNTNMYRAPWVTMTNVVGSQVSYTRFAYVVLDDMARVNPALMTGAGTGFTNSTNWYTGPQDINVTTITNSAGDQLLTASQLTQLLANSNSYGYSDATLGKIFPSVAAYQTNETYLTSSMNPSFDVIPAWYTNGGMPKYNINDLATNTAYGATPLARSLNIASIITNNLPNFYLRDAALSTVGTNNTPGTVDKTLYAQRLAANIVDYISPDGIWGATDYSTNMTGISPQGHGIYPIQIAEVDYVIAGAGTSPTIGYTSSTVISQFWLNCWNPYTTPVTINSASVYISSQPSFKLPLGGTNNAPLEYTNSLYVISGANGTKTNTLPYVVNPNEFVALGFVPQTNVIYANSANTNGPSRVPGNGLPLQQYSLTINGQTTAQSGAMNPGRTNAAGSIGGGMEGGVGGLGLSGAITTNYNWGSAAIAFYANQVADPRFESYYNDQWDSSSAGEYWKGAAYGEKDKAWGGYLFSFPIPTHSYPASVWINRDNIARSPASWAADTNFPAGMPMTNEFPDQVPSVYNQAIDSNAAPEVIRNGSMVSIGELGHVDDPAYANDTLTGVPLRGEAGNGFENAYTTGGARSLRVGRTEETGVLTTNNYPAAEVGWNVTGERAISLLDLFTVNNANTNATLGTTNSLFQSMNYGGALGRININTASTNVLAALLSAVQITSDPALTNSAGQSLYPAALTNVPAMITDIVTNRPYSSLSDLYKIQPLFDVNTNYAPPFQMTASGVANLPPSLNVFNRTHQEAFGKLVQHLTVQSRSYRIFVIGQVLDSTQKPRGSVAMEAGIYLQYNPDEAKYNPIIQYVHILK